MHHKFHYLFLKHNNQLNDINYLHRNKGGRGLMSLEESYKNCKIKLVLKLYDDSDHRMELVKSFHEKNLESKSAKEILDDTDCIIEITPKEFSVWKY